MYYYFRERMAEDGLDPTKRQGKVISKKVKKTYENRRKQNEPAYEEAYQECSRCLRCDHFGFGVFRGGRSTKW